MHRFTAALVCLVLSCALPLSAQDAPAPARVDDAEAAYIAVLEACVRSDWVAARKAADELKTRFPDSEYARRVDDFLPSDAPEGGDNSGIVTFYLGGLVTGVSSASLLFEILGINPESDPVPSGALMLGGAGLGLGSSWLMSRGRPIGAAQDLWIESVEALTVANWLSLYMAFADDQPDPKIVSGGTLAAMIAARGAAWLTVRDRDLSFGQAAFASQSAAWAAFYEAIALSGLVRCENRYVNGIAAAAAMDAGIVVGALGQEALRWSSLRSGLVSVGGIAGMLVGTTVNVMAGLTPFDADRSGTIVFASCAIAGQALAVAFTGGLEPESRRGPVAGGIPGVSLAVLPVADGRGGGVRLSLGLAW